MQKSNSLTFGLFIRITENSNDAFILHLYRSKNKQGFIKSFSDCASLFSKGFSNLEKCMNYLWAQEVFLWPRYHQSIASVLDNDKGNAPEVLEIHVSPSKEMLEIQFLLTELTGKCLAELQKAIPTVFLVFSFFLTHSQ